MVHLHLIHANRSVPLRKTHESKPGGTCVVEIPLPNGGLCLCQARLSIQSRRDMGEIEFSELLLIT